ncbi:MAG: hypothetical protein ACI9LM_000926 [Alteromonadaceae bacterium]|jgi:hypothetical protein
MKNLLILIVFAAVILHFYPQPKLERWYNNQKQAALTAFSDATDTRARLSPSIIYKDLTPEFKHFSAVELKILKEITASRKLVANFNSDYCRSDKKSPRFHATNQQKICKVISKYQNLL